MSSMIEFKQFLNSEYCLKCKQCCIFEDTSWLPHLLSDDRKNLAKSEVCAKKFKNGLECCEFMNKSDHTCIVYEKRPFECRLYPFLLIDNQGPLDLAVHLGCPYVLSKVNGKEFSEYCEYLADILLSKDNLKKLKPEKSVFHWYPEIELFFIKKDILSGI